jgi:DNA-binding LacI/PurR family transcriptional regulator
MGNMGEPMAVPEDGEQEMGDGATAGPVTMRDVADAAGVSLSTVSRVLNNAPSSMTIADATRERIQTSARQLGFTPNPFARALRGAPTMLLGAVVRDFSDPFFAGAIEALAAEAHDHGYGIVLGHVQGGGEDDRRAAQAVLAPGHCDAVLVLGELKDRPRLREALARVAVPVVALWQGGSPIRFPTVDVDDTTGIPIGLRHLVNLGHRRIAFVSARLPGDNPTRELAYAEFMDQHLEGVPDGYLQRCDNSLAGGEGALETLLRLPHAPTAVACSTDVAAVGVLHGAHSHGVPVPRGISVVGYDDLMFAAYTNPALTTLRMPTTEIVAEAVRSAIALARSRSTNAVREGHLTVYQPTLVVRASTAPPAG